MENQLKALAEIAKLKAENKILKAENAFLAEVNDCNLIEVLEKQSDATASLSTRKLINLWKGSRYMNKHYLHMLCCQYLDLLNQLQAVHDSVAATEFVQVLKQELELLVESYKTQGDFLDGFPRAVTARTLLPHLAENLIQLSQRKPLFFLTHLRQWSQLLQDIYELEIIYSHR